MPAQFKTGQNQLSASVLREMFEATQKFKSQKPGWSYPQLYIRNDTGSAQPALTVYGLKDIINDSIEDNSSLYKDYPTFAGIIPHETGDDLWRGFAIGITGAAAGAVIPAMNSGITTCNVFGNLLSHNRADLLPGDATQLQSGYAGSAEIIYPIRLVEGVSNLCVIDMNNSGLVYGALDCFSAQDIPANSVAEVMSRLGNTVFVKKPTADNLTNVVIVLNAIDAAGFGSFGRCSPPVSIDNGVQVRTTGDPEAGDSIGTENGAWTMKKGNTGFLCIGDYLDQSYLRPAPAEEHFPAPQGGDFYTYRYIYAAPNFKQFRRLIEVDSYGHIIVVGNEVETTIFTTAACDP